MNRVSKQVSKSRKVVFSVLIQAYKTFAQDQDCVDFLKNETVKSKLANAKKISEVQAKDYEAILYVGGHGPVIDLAQDPVNAKLASEVCLRQ